LLTAGGVTAWSTPAQHWSLAPAYYPIISIGLNSKQLSYTASLDSHLEIKVSKSKLFGKIFKFLCFTYKNSMYSYLQK
jgi:hypothetical protein